MNGQTFFKDIESVFVSFIRILRIRPVGTYPRKSTRVFVNDSFLGNIFFARNYF